jgi:hypothetical protein
MVPVPRLSPAEPGSAEGELRPIPVRIETTHNTSKYAFVPGWRFPGEVDRWFSDNLSRLDDPAPRPIAAIPCGSSNLGDLRIDKFPYARIDLSRHGKAPNWGRPSRPAGDRYPQPSIMADFFKLPFKDGSIGTIIADPPWNLQFQARMDYMGELARVHRHGGLLLWTAPWLPLHGVWAYDGVYFGHSRVGLPRDARLLVRAIRRTTTKMPTRHQVKAEQRRRKARGRVTIENSIE